MVNLYGDLSNGTAASYLRKLTNQNGETKISSNAVNFSCPSKLPVLNRLTDANLSDN